MKELIRKGFVIFFNSRNNVIRKTNDPTQSSVFVQYFLRQVVDYFFFLDYAIKLLLESSISVACYISLSKCGHVTESHNSLKSSTFPNLRM